MTESPDMGELPIEDALEQTQAIEEEPDRIELNDLPTEANAADVLEQQIEVPLDEDEVRD
ncbi:MAG: hypothetical protein ICV72_07385 [Aldersonia sp.]|nr:hypothetical protein [Aldersonia sp.]